MTIYFVFISVGIFWLHVELPNKAMCVGILVSGLNNYCGTLYQTRLCLGVIIDLPVSDLPGGF